MTNEIFEIESFKPFSESLIWQLNRDFYQQVGIQAWSDDIVPHHMTSNSMVGKTYAELILGFLKDLALQGKTNETVYILELGAGHGRLAFHILKHLDNLSPAVGMKLPPYCFILSDIVEDNLAFFRQHPQFQSYFDAGTLDVAYFDGIDSKEISLRVSGVKIRPQTLKQPLIAIANYFFDSLPTDLFHIQNNEISACSIALHTAIDPKELNAEQLIKNIKLNFQKKRLNKPFYNETEFDDLLESYRNLDLDTYLFFPKKSIQCLNNLKDFSTSGLMVLSMDKGFHEIHDIDKKEEPEIITHGSFSLWVNYHALGTFCRMQGGKALFPSFSTFHLDVGCLLFVTESETYIHTDAAYQRFINDLGPDDFNSIKKIAYQNIAALNISQLIALFRLSAYDSTFFIKLLPRLKQLVLSITFNERKRCAETLNAVWDMYFNINESTDLACEIGGLFYGLGFYEDALSQFQHSINSHGPKSDILYNKALCYYQLRQDHDFTETLDQAKRLFPNNVEFNKLDRLDLAAV